MSSSVCRLPNGHIRFEKCMALARLVSHILTYKETVVSIILMYLESVYNVGGGGGGGRALHAEPC